MTEPDLQQIAAIAHGIRRRVLEHTLANNGGYMSQACSAAELLACLYGGGIRLAAIDAPFEPGPFRAVPRAAARHTPWPRRAARDRRGRSWRARP